MTSRNGQHLKITPAATEGLKKNKKKKKRENKNNKQSGKTQSGQNKQDRYGQLSEAAKTIGASADKSLLLVN